DLLIHRIRLDALERTVVPLHLILRRLAPLLCRPLDVLGDALHLGEQLPAGCVLLHPLTGPEQHLVLFALSQEPPQLARLLVDHVPPSSSRPASKNRGWPNRSSCTATRDQPCRRASARTASVRRSSSSSAAASAERSTAITRSNRPSTASDNAMQPHPVPMSATTPRLPPPASRIPVSRSTSSTSPSVSGRGISARGSRSSSSERKSARPTAS